MNGTNYEVPHCGAPLPILIPVGSKYSPQDLVFKDPVVHGTLGCRKKKTLLVNLAVPPAPVRFPSQRPLAPSVASVTSVANDKGDNENLI